MSEALDVALNYVNEFGWYVVPLWWIKEDGICACRRGVACGRSAGKHPITPNGINDSTRNLEIINQWWTQYPDAGIAADLRRSELVLLGPDSVEWQEKFEEKGLHIGGAIIDTGGGPGHFHYIHKRPSDMLIGRINRSGEFDLMTEGVLPLPPSKHYSGKERKWVVPPSKWLPFAPDLTVQMLQVQKEKDTEVSPILPDGARNGPPVKLDALAMEWWNGLRVAHHKGTQTLDSSGTIWAMGMCLAEAGASEWLIADTLADWSIRWGLRKYQERPKEYERVAQKVCALVHQAQKGSEVEDEGLQVYSLTDLLEMKFERPAFFVDPLVTSTGITLIAGASGSLKTAVIADLFLSIFEKRKWLGHYETTAPCEKVLYLDGEVGHQGLQERLKSMGAKNSNNLDYIYRSWQIENNKEFEGLLEFVRKGNYDLILVDSISSMHNLEERTDTTVLVMKRLRMLADAANCPIIVLANFNKSTSEKRELLERISGPSVYRNKSTNIIILRRFGGKKLLQAHMELHKGWIGGEGEARTIKLQVEGDHLAFSSEVWVKPGDEEEEEHEESKTNPVDIANLHLALILKDIPLDEEIPLTYLMRAVHEVPGVTQAIAEQTVLAAVERGVLIQPTRKGKGGRLFTKRSSEVSEVS